MNELDKSVADLTTPKSQAFGDYMNGEDGENNPYIDGSEYHREYSAEMKRLLGESK